MYTTKFGKILLSVKKSIYIQQQTNNKGKDSLYRIKNKTTISTYITLLFLIACTKKCTCVYKAQNKGL